MRRIATEYFFAEPLAPVFAGLAISDNLLWRIRNSLKSQFCLISLMQLFKADSHIVHWIQCFTFSGDKEGYLCREERTAIAGGGSESRQPQIGFYFCSTFSLILNLSCIEMWKRSTLSTILCTNLPAGDQHRAVVAAQGSSCSLQFHLQRCRIYFRHILGKYIFTRNILHKYSFTIGQYKLLLPCIVDLRQELVGVIS